MATSKVSFFKYGTLAEYENAKATSIIDPQNSVVFVAEDKSIYLNGVKYTGNPRFVGVPKILYNDPTFKTSDNNTVRYNNANISITQFSRISASDDCPTDSKYMMRFAYPANGNAQPGLGGFAHLNCVSRPNAIFVHKIIAKFPEGYTMNRAGNYIGDNAINEWITSNKGTGKFQEYEYVVHCGTGERSKFSTFSHVYFDGPTDKEFIADIAFSTVYDYTESLDIQAELKKIADSDKTVVKNITAGDNRVAPSDNLIKISGSNGITVSGAGNTVTVDGSNIKNDIRYIKVVDSRDTDETPKVRARDLYGGPNISADFKYSSTVGNPSVKNSGSSDYSTILTVAGWTDSSGGYPTLLSVGNGLAFRTGISDTKWSGWQEFYHTGNLNWNTLKGKPSAFPTNWDNITGKPTIPKIPTIYISGKSTRLLPNNDNDIVFKAGNNITLDGSGSTLTISATGISSSIEWKDIKNKPSTFTPSSHTHKWSEITEKPSAFPTNWANVANKPSIPSMPTIYISGKNTRISPDGDNDFVFKAGSNIILDGSDGKLTISATGGTGPSSVSWDNVTDKPSIFPTNWANVANKPSIPKEPRIFLRGLLSRITLDSSNDFNFEAGDNITFKVVNGGLKISSTGGTSSVDWSDIKNKPSVFPPSSHRHSWSEISDKPTIPTIPSIYVYGPNSRITPDGHNDYNLRAGSNVSLSVSGNELTISATGGSSSVDWSNITNKPSIPALPRIYLSGQNKRISPDGDNDIVFKAGNNITLEGSGSTLTINASGGSSSVSWSSITDKPTYLSKWNGLGGSSMYPIGDNSSTIIKTSGKMLAANGFFETSDIRLKDVTDSLHTTINNLVRDSFIRALNPIKYTLKEDKSDNKTEHIGLIAQEVELYYPELVTTNEDGYKSLDYAKLSVIALAEIKDLKKEIAELRQKIESLK